jgi:hypothetical protein
MSGYADRAAASRSREKARNEREKGWKLLKRAQAASSSPEVDRALAAVGGEVVFD